MQKIIIYSITCILLIISLFFGYKMYQEIYPPIPSSLPTPTATPTTTPLPETKRKPIDQSVHAPTPTQPPKPDGNTYACDPQGICNAYADVKQANCPVVYQFPNCDNECAKPEVRCQR